VPLPGNAAEVGGASSSGKEADVKPREKLSGLTGKKAGTGGGGGGSGGPGGGPGGFGGMTPNQLLFSIVR
jgi:AFG3 family protein